jgi:RNA polymerase sigma-B factor
MSTPLQDDQLLELFRDYRSSRNRRIRDQLVIEHQWIARRCARRFSDRGEPYADLLQVAQIGVVKAVERFDPSLGHRFASYAMPTVMGELRRHFRDTTWHVAVPRRSKDLIGRLNSTIETLSHQLERSPLVEEVAEAMGVEPEVVLETMEAGRCYRASSLDGTPLGDAGKMSDAHERMGADDPDLDDAPLRLSTAEAVRQLDERSRSIILWRFYEGCTQSEIGDRLGIGQVQVSRLLRAALGRLRSSLAEHEPLAERPRRYGVLADDGDHSPPGDSRSADHGPADSADARADSSDRPDADPDVERIIGAVMRASSGR